MADRQKRRIGIIFNFHPNWMGGIIYIQNLIELLNYLDIEERPEVFLFYKKDLTRFVDEIKYPLLNPVELEFPATYKTFFLSVITRKNIFVQNIIANYNLDAIYPVQNFPVRIKSSTKLISWFADLQHKYYPGFFSRTKLIERDARVWFILRNCNDLVVSSQCVEDDFRRFYKIPGKIRFHVFHFVSIIKDLEYVSVEDVFKKYKLPEKYYVVSNQFHKHKNHKVLFETLGLLKREGVSVNLALTGKLPSDDKSEYLRALNEIILTHKLGDQISFLGVIPRAEQLLIMKYSQAVIQPSLFEGWSTVIEDAKSLQIPVIASNIPVNMEQLGPNGVYFNPLDPAELANIIRKQPVRNLSDNFYESYSERVKNAARRFIEIVDMAKP
jgi:glycosyltransferase involved in cell wall biosynthesis